MKTDIQFRFTTLFFTPPKENVATIHPDGRIEIHTTADRIKAVRKLLGDKAECHWVLLSALAAEREKSEELKKRIQALSNGDMAALVKSIPDTEPIVNKCICGNPSGNRLTSFPPKCADCGKTC